MTDEIPDLPGVSHRFVEAAGVRLHVAEAGEGEPLVLLHGWPQHWYMWRRLIPALAAGHRVIAPDLRGFGWSDAPPGAYEKETLAGDILALMDALGHERVGLMGHDWGGWVGFLIALRAPERVSRYMALSILPPWQAGGTPTPRMLLRAWYQFVIGAPLLGPAVMQHTPFVDQVFQKNGGEAVWSEQERLAFADRFREGDRARASAALYRTFLTKERLAIARGAYGSQRLTVPTRLLVGRSDPVIRPELLEGCHEQADDLQVEWIDGGHFLPEQQPEAVLERALAFLDVAGSPPPPGTTKK